MDKMTYIESDDNITCDHNLPQVINIPSNEEIECVLTLLDPQYIVEFIDSIIDSAHPDNFNF